MSRPKTPIKSRVVRWLTANPNKEITYQGLARKMGSHAIAIGQIMRAIGTDPNFKQLTKQVVHTTQKQRSGSERK